ncbi:glycoside hydrolase superfamily, partial [Truncatella angustata]
MCGPYSIDGDQKCGMNLCCSAYGWCGTDDVHCDSTPTEANGMAPCQADYGLCKIIPAPSCGEGSGSTNGRAIGYYQASNTRDRLCNRISPSQINLDGLTHLYFAFAKFDPSTFAIVPGDTADEELYPEFTALQSKGVKTWVAIGGFDFSDPGTATHTAWSDMVSKSASRSAFITSLMAFMKKWGFQGVDIDWEYPAAAARGGVLADTVNFVSLVKEMKSAFGDSYGISLTLAPDYWYLRGFDAKGMEPYVDFFGFMAYDLHGSWDTDVKTLGSKVRGQADIRDISNDTLPLWFDDLTPSKINFGLAYYGRGYTLSDPSCNTLNCAFSGPSKPGTCTNFAGVMSLLEIENIIKEKKLQPTLLSEAMMKQITWDDQWIGYDDADTIKLKKAWADGQCFGGTMVWSVDFNSGSGSGDTPTKTTDGTC